MKKQDIQRIKNCIERYQSGMDSLSDCVHMIDQSVRDIEKNPYSPIRHKLMHQIDYEICLMRRFERFKSDYGIQGQVVPMEGVLLGQSMDSLLKLIEQMVGDVH